MSYFKTFNIFESLLRPRNIEARETTERKRRSDILSKTIPIDKNESANIIRVLSRNSKHTCIVIQKNSNVKTCLKEGALKLKGNYTSKYKQLFHHDWLDWLEHSYDITITKNSEDNYNVEMIGTFSTNVSGYTSKLDEFESELSLEQLYSFVIGKSNEEHNKFLDYVDIDIEFHIGRVGESLLKPRNINRRIEANIKRIADIIKLSIPFTKETADKTFRKITELLKPDTNSIELDVSYKLQSDDKCLVIDFVHTNTRKSTTFNKTSGIKKLYLTCVGEYSMYVSNNYNTIGTFNVRITGEAISREIPEFIFEYDNFESDLTLEQIKGEVHRAVNSQYVEFASYIRTQYKK